MKNIECILLALFLGQNPTLVFTVFSLQACFEEQKAGSRPSTAKCVTGKELLRAPCYEVGARKPQFKAGPSLSINQEHRATGKAH